VGEDDKEAEALRAKYFVGDAVGDLFRGRGAAVQPPTQTQAGFGLGELRFCGGPDTVVRQITDFHEATGVGVIDVAFGGAGLSLQEAMQSMRLFATEVLPRVRHVGAASRPQAAVAAANA
jgi:alkanesulfonate monooxygenase SsuD/methylene tetrahydromethanopterin reductase-like flavin-dependent oxidoreductase (luciferase family)